MLSNVGHIKSARFTINRLYGVDDLSFETVASAVPEPALKAFCRAGLVARSPRKCARPTRIRGTWAGAGGRGHRLAVLLGDADYEGWVECKDALATELPGRFNPVSGGREASNPAE